MIVKNEEKNLQRCLDSFLPIINMKDDETLEPLVELVIVDTGSTDRTINIAKKYTDKVYEKEFVPWSFADARNYAISKCTGEKILIVDADDELLNKSIYPLMDYILNPKFDDQPTFFIWIYNIYDKSGQYTQFRQARMFKNDGDFKYEGSVHNKPKVKTPYFYCDDIFFNHHGYNWSSSKDLLNQKYDRSLPMLLSDHEKDPHDTHALTHLVKTYRIKTDWENVIKYGEIWIEEMDKIKAAGNFHEGWFAYLEVFIGLLEAYLTRKDEENALRIYNKSKEYSERIPDIDLQLGFFYLEKDNAKAAHYLEKCLEIFNSPGSPYEDLMTTNIKMNIPRVYNFLARYYLIEEKNKLRAGQMLNDGIYSNEYNVPLRWDVWNWQK